MCVTKVNDVSALSGISSLCGRTKRRVSSFVCLSACSFVRSFVSLSVVSVRAVHPMGDRTAMLYTNLRGDKNPGTTNKYTKFGQLIIRKIIKIIATRCHILRLKCTKFYSRRLSIRSSVRPSPRWSLTLASCE